MVVTDSAILFSKARRELGSFLSASTLALCTINMGNDEKQRGTIVFSATCVNLTTLSIFIFPYSTGLTSFVTALLLTEVLAFPYVCEVL